MAATREATVVATVAPPETLYEKLKPGPGRSAPDVAEHQRARIHAAMIELIGGRGYGAVTARELSRLSGVSTRAFYKHFENKEDCFARTHDLIVRRTARRVGVAQAGEGDWRERLRLAFNAFVRELAREPRAARLALIEACSVGPAALERVRHAERVFEAMVAESFTRAPGGIVVPQLVIEGIVAGTERVARLELIAGRELELPALGDSLAQWALSYAGKAALLADLDHHSVSEGSAAELSLIPSSDTENEKARSSTGDRAVLLSAVAKLAARDGYRQLTIARICRSAGLSRRSFDHHFQGVEDCFLAALEEQTQDAIVSAGAHAQSSSWTGDVQRTIAGICDQVASNHTLSRLLFVEAFAAGARGTACRERLMTHAAGRLHDAPRPDARLSEPTVAASMGAVWGILGHRVAAGQAQRVRQLVPMLAYLVLAPTIGAEAAVTEVRAETGFSRTNDATTSVNNEVTDRRKQTCIGTE